MINEIKNIIRDACLRHKGVRSFRYAGEDLINAQNGAKYIQAVMDDVSLMELNITTGIFVWHTDLYLLAFPGRQASDVSAWQDACLTVAVDVMALLEKENPADLRVHDFSILTLSRFSDDSAAGVKISLDLEVPNPIDLCNYEENFSDEPWSGDTDHRIDISAKTVGDIDIKVITLPRDKTVC